MANNLEEKILNLLDELNADDYEEGRSWNGYKVYIPVYDELAIVGLPFVILEKDNEVRISTGSEAMEYLDFENTEEAQDMDTDSLSRAQSINIEE